MARPWRQLAQHGEPHPQQRPDQGQIRHVHGHARLADVPEHVGRAVHVREVEDLGHERREDHEDAEREDDHQHDLLPPGEPHAHDQRDRDAEHQHVGADVEAPLHDGVVLEGGALRVRRRDGPVAVEGPTGREEGYLGRHPAGGDVDGEVADDALVARETHGEARKLVVET